MNDLYPSAKKANWGMTKEGVEKMNDDWASKIPMPENVGTALPAGTTKGTLDDIELRTVEKWNEPGLMEDKFFFKFKLAGGGMVVTRVRPKMTQKSGMLNLLASMSPNGVPSTALESPDAYIEFAKSFLGKSFWIKHEPSKDGKWNNFLSLMPIMENPLDKDDIPFG